MLYLNKNTGSRRPHGATARDDLRKNLPHLTATSCHQSELAAYLVQGRPSQVIALVSPHSQLLATPPFNIQRHFTANMTQRAAEHPPTRLPSGQSILRMRLIQRVGAAVQQCNLWGQSVHARDRVRTFSSREIETLNMSKLPEKP